MSNYDQPLVSAGRHLQRRRRPRWGLAAVLALVLVIAAVAVVLAAGGSGHSHAQAPRSLPVASRPHHLRAVRIVVEASGDLLIHSPIWERALVLGGGHYNFAPLFAKIKPFIRRASLPLCHVETPMTPAPPKGYPVFNTPPELARAIKQTGWRACSTAATHSLDEGQTGVDDTISALNHARVLHAGTYSSAAAQRKPLIMKVKGIKVAFLSYTDITNGIPSPHPWSVNRASAAQILAEARRARIVVPRSSLSTSTGAMRT